MNRVRQPPLQHPLAPVFDRAIDALGMALSPESIRQYRGTVRKFLTYPISVLIILRCSAWSNCAVNPTSSAGCPAYTRKHRRS